MGTKVISQERLLKDIERVLNNPIFIPDLSDKSVQRYHDDHDGTWEGLLLVTELPDGDMAISTDKSKWQRHYVSETILEEVKA